MQETFGTLEGRKVAYFGDGASNMARTWALAAYQTGLDLHICAPAAYQLDLNGLPEVSQNGSVTLTEDAESAASGAHVLYTDVWVSMGFEEEKVERLSALGPFQVNDATVAAAADNVCIMHCLPAHRGEEITGSVLDGCHSVIWDQAENRLHAQKAIMAKLMA